MTESYDPVQLGGSEYGGGPTFAGGIQRKGSEALTNGEKLRLGYLTGDESDTRLETNLEDRRQMYGLLPAAGGRPVWLDNVNPNSDPRKVSEVRAEGRDKAP